MPCVRISTGEWIAGRELEMIEAVQSALVAAFRIPESDRDVVLDLYGENRRIIAGGRSDRYTRVELIGIPGRSMDAKRNLYRTIVSNLEAIGVPRMEMRIVLIEPPPGNWGIKGGLPASEVELGFRLDV